MSLAGGSMSEYKELKNSLFIDYIAKIRHTYRKSKEKENGNGSR